MRLGWATLILFLLGPTRVVAEHVWFSHSNGDSYYYGPGYSLTWAVWLTGVLGMSVASTFYVFKLVGAGEHYVVPLLLGLSPLWLAVGSALVVFIAMSL